MFLRFYRAIWGVIASTDGQLARSPVHTFEQALAAIAKLGYDGIECPLKMVYEVGEDRFADLLRQHRLKVIFQIFSDGPVAPGAGGVLGGPYPGHPAPGESIDDHVAVFVAQARAAAAFNPTHINSHSLRDYYTAAEARRFFTEALSFQKNEGVTVLHETHRKRYLHSPWVARDLLLSAVGGGNELDDLQLVADLSHFTCVAETDPTDRQLTSVIQRLAPKIRHIHGRVGYDHGPQVADPRTDEWMPYTRGFEKWWSMIWAAQRAAGVAESTFTPEHGPPSYQQCVPGTREPLADIWEVNHFIAKRQQARFADEFGAENTSKLK